MISQHLDILHWVRGRGRSGAGRLLRVRARASWVRDREMERGRVCAPGQAVVVLAQAHKRTQVHTLAHDGRSLGPASGL